MAIRPSSVRQRVPLPSPLASSLLDGPDPASDLARAASPTVTRLLATVVTDPDFESTAAFSLVAELVDFAASRRLDYVASLITESESVCPPSLGGEPALGNDVLEDRQFELECFAAALPHFASMLLCLEGDLDAPDIPTPRSYAEAIAAQRDYELHSLNFSTVFLQGSLHKEIWLRCPPGFTGSFPADESVEPSGPYPELVGCLITSGMGPVLGGRGSVVLTGHSDASMADDRATLRFCEAEIYARAMAAQELRWLTYMLTDLGERPRSPPVL
ncbi:unnamed protein product, partial [Closterium sp. NIES-54]